MISCRYQQLTLTLLVMRCCFCHLVWMVLFEIITSHLICFGCIHCPNLKVAYSLSGWHSWNFKPVTPHCQMPASALFVWDWSLSHTRKAVNGSTSMAFTLRSMDLKCELGQVSKSRRNFLLLVLLNQITLEWIIHLHTIHTEFVFILFFWSTEPHFDRDSSRRIIFRLLSSFQLFTTHVIKCRSAVYGWLYCLYFSHFILFNCDFWTWLTSSELLVCSWCSHGA